MIALNSSILILLLSILLPTICSSHSTQNWKYPRKNQTITRSRSVSPPKSSIPSKSLLFLPTEPSSDATLNIPKTGHKRDNFIGNQSLKIDPSGSPKLILDESGHVIGRDDCVCVHYLQCEKGNIVTDGSGIITPRLGFRPGEDNNRDGNNPSFCGNFYVCCSTPGTKPDKTKYLHRCGIQNPVGINSRILSLDKTGEADFGEWPWQAALLNYANGDDNFICGGTLIDDYFILTVAHCVSDFVNDFSKLKVRLGEWDTSNKQEIHPDKDYNVERVISHPEFGAHNLWNDVALIKLNRKVEFQPNIDSVCLPEPHESHVGEECTATGWGTTDSVQGRYSTILKEVSLKIVSHAQCQDSLRKTRLGQRFELHEGFLCAGGEESRDSCKGDGGGPLVCRRQDGTYSLAGLISWGIDCGHKGVPGVYVDVTKYLDWIFSVTKKPSSYYASPVTQT